MIYVTMTTVPDRLNLSEHIESITKNVHSLLNQITTEEYKVVINIPYNYKNYTSVSIPEWLTDLLNTNEKLILLREENDYGPVTNLVFPLKQLELDPDDILIVCDDDHEYEPTMVAYHLKMLQKYPGRHAICFRGNGPLELRTWYENDKKLAKFWNANGVIFPTDRDIYLKLPDHWHSVSYRRRFFEEDFLDEEFLSKTWNNDHLLAHYAWNHNFYFLCAHVLEQLDTRPVNHDGRGSSSYPIKTQLSFNPSGCYFWRQKNNDDSFIQRFDNDKGVMDWNILFKQ